MRKFTNSENQQQQALSIVQRKRGFFLLSLSSRLGDSITDTVVGQIDVLEKREPGGSSSSSESSESERE